MGLKKNVIMNFGANAFGQAVTVLIQLASVPIYLKYWGVKEYGEWLILSAIPTYIGLSDVGFASAAATEMTVAYSRGEMAKARQIYQSIWTLITFISTMIGVAMCLILMNIDITRFLSINVMNQEDAKLTLLVMVVYVLIGLQANILNAAFRSVGRYAFVTFFGNIVRLGEWFGAVLTIFLGGKAPEVAVAMLCVKAIGTFFIYRVAETNIVNLNIGWGDASYKTIRFLFKPAITYMAFPMGLSLNLQGMVLVVGAILGPTAVVIFSTYRTLTRTLVQFVTLLNYSAWPEISAAYGEKKIELIMNLHRKVSGATLWIALLSVVFISITGDWIVKTWTHASFQSNHLLLLTMLVVSFVNVLWQTSWVVLVATNRHIELGLIFIGCTLATLFLSVCAGKMFGLIGVGIVLILCEIPMLICTIRKALNELDDQVGKYCKFMFRLNELLAS